MVVFLVLPALCGAGVEGRWNVSIECDTNALDSNGNFQSVNQHGDQVWDMQFMEEYNWFGQNGWVTVYYTNVYDRAGVFQGSGVIYFFRDKKGKGFFTGYLYSACVYLNLTKDTDKRISGNMHTQAFRSLEYCDAIIGLPSQVGLVDSNFCTIKMKR
jgi:hypothetical protein